MVKLKADPQSELVNAIINDQDKLVEFILKNFDVYMPLVINKPGNYHITDEPIDKVIIKSKGVFINGKLYEITGK